MSKEQNEAVKKFGERLKVEPVKGHVQVVNPIIEVIDKKETQLNVWIPDTLLKKIRIHSAETGKSIKEITNAALTSFFK